MILVKYCNLFFNFFPSLIFIILCVNQLICATSPSLLSYCLLNNHCEDHCLLVPFAFPLSFISRFPCPSLCTCVCSCVHACTHLTAKSALASNRLRGLQSMKHLLFFTAKNWIKQKLLRHLKEFILHMPIYLEDLDAAL